MLLMSLLFPHEEKILLLFFTEFLISHFHRAEGITLSMAGNAHSVPVERVTGEDFWILSKILEKNPYINGMSP